MHNAPKCICLLMLVFLLVTLINQICPLLLRSSLRRSNVLQFASQFLAFRSTSFHVDEYHDRERKTDENSKEPESLR